MHSSCSLIQVWNCAMEVLKGRVLSGEYKSHLIPPGTFLYSLILSIPTQFFVSHFSVLQVTECFVEVWKQD